MRVQRFDTTTPSSSSGGISPAEQQRPLIVERAVVVPMASSLLNARRNSEQPRAKVELSNELKRLFCESGQWEKRSVKSGD